MPPKRGDGIHPSSKKKTKGIAAPSFQLDTLNSHHAIGVPELLLLYFSYLSPLELANAAQVCKTWSPFAINVLWAQHEVPLTAILRQLAWLYLSSESRMFRSYATDSPTLSLKKWSSFLRRYPHKVNRLYINAAIDRTALGHIMHLQEATGIGLCPNVEHLCVSLDRIEWDQQSTLVLLRNSSLREVTVKDCHHLRNVKALIKTLVRDYSRIQAFTFITRLDWMATYGWLFPPLYDVTLGEFHGLRAVDLRDISLEGWISLADCPLLQAVTVSQTEPWDEFDVETASEGHINRFPSLDKLSMCSLAICSAALAGSAIPNLRHLSAGLLRDEDEGAFIHLVERSRDIEELEIKFKQSVISRLTIDALATLSRLLTVELGGNIVSLIITDPDITLLVSSLPQLHILSLSMNVIEDILLTANSLLAVLEHCRVLTDLTLPLNLRKAFDDGLRLDKSSSPSQSMKRLTLRHITIFPNVVVQIAHTLAMCFPRVEKFAAMSEKYATEARWLAKEFKAIVDVKAECAEVARRSIRQG
ncbi:hypothetical protein FRB94_001383 [Tulasnella sp. JGI-2019a]|nr:hypothetical protein FRB94_001383 [Tulasnella sp. JGI-2019a]KAG9034485.1 hypothetical protein FRB95_013161 [Tulasnella sp. JGI-2019a]